MKEWNIENLINGKIPLKPWESFKHGNNIWFK
jgi:hypothetical protein